MVEFSEQTQWPYPISPIFDLLLVDLMLVHDNEIDLMKQQLLSETG